MSICGIITESIKMSRAGGFNFSISITHLKFMARLFYFASDFYVRNWGTIEAIEWINIKSYQYIFSKSSQF